MKAGKEHRVPLPSQVIELLRNLKANNDSLRDPSDFVFPGQKPNTCLSDAAALEFLKRIDRKDITPHGMRACARMWGANETVFPREICEQALAHSNRDRVEAAYQRSDLLEKRRELMEAWANYCSSES
jgi:integrase